VDTPLPISTRDLAAQLGLSHNTVARALRNLPHVSVATRERVLKAAEAAGYRASPLVTALMTQVRQHHRVKPTGEVVAYLTSTPTEKGWETLPSHVQQFEGAQHRAAELGFTLQPFWLGPHGSQSRRVARILSARGVRGSVLAPRPKTDVSTLELNWQTHATIVIGYSMSEIHAHRAVHDSVTQIAACYTNLRHAGNKRIGLALHQQEVPPERPRWIAGYCGAQWRYGDEMIPPLLFDSFSDNSAFLRWFDTHRPDAVIGIWPDHPLRWLRERSVRVPEEVAYATLDLPGNQVGQLAGIQQNNYGLGMAAMDLLAGQLFRNETGMPQHPATIIIDGTWINGPTAAKRANCC
jgi:LacI family transcriptional regulator